MDNYEEITKKIWDRTCTNCGRGYSEGGWRLSDYYGISGQFCSPCYNKVSHDSYGNPDQPGEYIAVLLKQKVPA